MSKAVFVEIGDFICKTRSLFFSQHKDIADIGVHTVYQEGIPFPPNS